jgi:hypothetical protein
MIKGADMTATEILVRRGRNITAAEARQVVATSGPIQAALRRRDLVERFAAAMFDGSEVRVQRCTPHYQPRTWRQASELEHQQFRTQAGDAAAILNNESVRAAVAS